MRSPAGPFPACPACGSFRALRIAYGYPSPEMWEASERGDVAIGGCLVGPESPDYECGDCHAPLPWVHQPDVEEDDHLAPLALIH